MQAIGNPILDIRKRYKNNPIIGYLHINSHKNKTDRFYEIANIVRLGILGIDETKLDESFPDPPFQLKDCQSLHFWKDEEAKYIS